MHKIIGGGLMALGVFGIVSGAAGMSASSLTGAGACLIFGAFTYFFWDF
jgi:hypothetical protein